MLTTALTLLCVCAPRDKNNNNKKAIFEVEGARTFDMSLLCAAGKIFMHLTCDKCATK